MIKSKSWQKQTFRVALLAGLSSNFLMYGQFAYADNACERQMHSASTKYDIPIGILYAVGLTETGRKSSLQPYALNIEGRTFFTSSATAAIAKFEEAQLQGAKLIDLGCMQINHYFHGRNFTSVDRMLDPATNVEYAARFLKQLYRREGSWTMAVARYHAGPHNDPAQKKYVCRVMENMIASGFGNWTSKARIFCDK